MQDNTQKPAEPFGKIYLRVPMSLKNAIVHAAKRRGMKLEPYIIEAVNARMQREKGTDNEPSR